MNENCADQPLCQPILVFPAKSLEMAYCLFTNVVFNYSHFVRLHFLSPESSAPVWQTKNRCFLLLKIDASSICLSTKAWRIAYFYKIPHISEKISISPDAFHKQLLIYSAVKLGYILKSIRQCALHEPWWGRAHFSRREREGLWVWLQSVESELSRSLCWRSYRDISCILGHHIVTLIWRFYICAYSRLFGEL